MAWVRDARALCYPRDGPMRPCRSMNLQGPMGSLMLAAQAIVSAPKRLEPLVERVKFIKESKS